jgi:hypothetical protein
MTRRVGIFPTRERDSIHVNVGYGVVVRLPELRSGYTAIDGDAAN